MAEGDDDDLNLDTGEKKEKEPMSTKKLIILMVSGFIVILLSTVVGLVLVLKDPPPQTETAAEGEAIEENAPNAKKEEDEEPEKEVEEDVEEEEGSSATRGQAVFYTIRPVFVVNFQSSKRAKFLQISVDVMARDEDVIDKVMDNLPLIKNDLVILFSSQKYENLKKVEGKEKLREEALKVIQNVLKKETGQPGVEDVLFTSFVMQ